MALGGRGNADGDEQQYGGDVDADALQRRLDSLQTPPAPRLPEPPKVKLSRPRLTQQELDRAFPGDKKVGFSGSGLSVDKADAPPSHVGASLMIGITFPVAIVVGAGIGIWVDHHYPHVAPWGTVVFTLIGIAAGVSNVWRAIAAVSGKSKG